MQACVGTQDVLVNFSVCVRVRVCACLRACVCVHQMELFSDWMMRNFAVEM